MDCRQTRPLLETLVDGELSAEHTLAIEAHLDGCESCGEARRFLEAAKVSVQRAVRSEVVPSQAFEDRLRLALSAEREKQRAERERQHAERERQHAEREKQHAEHAEAALVVRGTDEDEPRFPARRLGERDASERELWFPRLVGARSLVPLAAAAALLFWLQDAERHSGDGSTARAVSTAASMGDTSMNFDQALDRLIDYHSSPPPAQVTSEELLPTFERDVGVRVHAPQLDRFGASWEGASVVPVRNHQAAYLRYRMPGRHVTVYVYDSRKVPVHRSLTRRMVHDHAVYLGEWRGYTVAAKENHGIGYAMASDLDDAQTAELLTEIH